MSQNNSPQFEFDLNSAVYGYNPLDDFMPDDGKDEEEDAEREVAPRASQTDASKITEDQRPASERIEELFVRMRRRRRVLLGILEFLEEPQTDDDLVAAIDRFQEFDVSAFNAANYCMQLERAGAIRKVNADGSNYSADDVREPDIVVIDGEEYYRPADAPEIYWVDTEDGKTYLASDDPYGRLAALISDNEYYAPVYKEILMFCDEAGRSHNDIGGIVNCHELTQAGNGHGQLFTSHFTDQLEKADALVWRGSWNTTDVGRRALAEILADVKLGAKTAPAAQVTVEGMGE